MNDADSKSGRARSVRAGLASGALSLERLLRAAAQRPDDSSVEVPFGFETRVVALWRSQEGSESMLLRRFVRRVTMLAAAIAIVAGAGAYHEANASRESSEPFTNEFAIADSALEFETSP
jgi:hypothetical protein